MTAPLPGIVATLREAQAGRTALNAAALGHAVRLHQRLAPLAGLRLKPATAPPVLLRVSDPSLHGAGQAGFTLWYEGIDHPVVLLWVEVNHGETGSSPPQWKLLVNVGTESLGEGSTDYLDRCDRSVAGFLLDHLDPTELEQLLADDAPIPEEVPS